MSDDLMTTVSWFAGIDWGSAEHQVCVMDTAGKVIGQRKFAHSGDGLAALCDWLVARTGATPGKIAVVIEVPHGPVVETLLERGFMVLAINPKQLDRFRDRFSPAGAKDDSRDAEVMAEAGRTEHHRLRRVDPADPLIVELRAAWRLAQELTEAKGREANRLRDELWRYYPQMLRLRHQVDVAAGWFLELWQLAPTPDEAARIGRRSIEGLLRRRHVKLDAATVLATLRQPPLTVPPATVKAAVRHISSLVPRLQLINQQLAQTTGELDRLTNAIAAEPAPQHQDPAPGQPNEQSDVAIYRSLPGAGRIVVAGLLSEAHQDLRRGDYHAVRLRAGVAPVTRQSGKRRQVIRRYACDARLSATLYHWARCAEQQDPRTRQYYKELRRRGHTHGRALRQVGDGLLRLACTLLQKRTLFDAQRYLKARQARCAESRRRAKAKPGNGKPGNARTHLAIP